MEAEDTKQCECWRYSYLEKCLENFVKSHRDKPGSCKKLAKAFPEIFKKCPEALTLISDTLGDKYTEVLHKSVKELMEASAVKEKLDQIEEFEENADQTWRPSGNPEEDLRAHIALAKQAEIQNLEEHLTTEDEDVGKLKEILAQKDKAIKQKLLHANAIAEEVASAARVAMSNQENLIHFLEKTD